MLPVTVPYDPKTTLLWPNTHAERSSAYTTAQMGMDAACSAEAATAIRAWDGYAPTPLHALPATARALGIGALHCKDESARFGLKTFKALGAPYAVQKLIAGTSTQTLACIADGNHERAVAWAGRRHGCRVVVYVPRGIAPARVRAAADLGAEVVRVEAPYDDTLIVLRNAAAREGWQIVSDVGYHGYEDIPRDCMAGYTLAAEEILAVHGQPFTHVFVQGGCGGLAAALLSVFWQRFGVARPHMTVVEPARAASLLEAARAGQPVRVRGNLETSMTGLAFGAVSLPAWPLLRAGVDAFMVIPEDAVAPAVQALAHPPGGDPVLAAGETGAAGMAAVQILAQRPDLAARIGLGTDSSVLIFVSEGVIGPQV